MTDPRGSLVVRRLGLADYRQTLAAMQRFTDQRGEATPDELWVLQHPPVFTQGQTGKAEHLLVDSGDIPVIATDRGGQITYHGPGQIVVYILVDLQRRGYGVRSLVTRIEQAVIATLSDYGIAAYTDAKAPGVYVDLRGERHKIASLGLRVRRGRSYHGVALNADMDLSPFARINPCGYPGLRVTQLRELGGPPLAQAEADFAAALARSLARAAESPTMPACGPPVPLD